MRFWWEALKDDDWKNALKTELRDLPQMETKLKMLEFRRRTDQPKTTASWSLVPGGSGPGDSTGRFVVSMEKLDEQILHTKNHCNDMRIAIDCLPEEQKTLIVNRYINGEPWKEIESVLGIEEWQRERQEEKAFNSLYELLNFDSLFKDLGQATGKVGDNHP